MTVPQMREFKLWEYDVLIEDMKKAHRSKAGCKPCGIQPRQQR